MQRLGRYKGGKWPKKVALGVISHRNLQVEGANEVVADIRRAMLYIDPEQIVLSTDCGFGRQGCNRLIAFHKAVSMARGANIIRAELGVPTRDIRAADPGSEALTLALGAAPVAVASVRAERPCPASTLHRIDHRIRYQVGVIDALSFDKAPPAIVFQLQLVPIAPAHQDAGQRFG